MTTTQQLATIEKVDLRDIWTNEATDFTPWLADNLSELGKALGLDLELESREAPVGGYSLDVLARDGSGRPVIIENQLSSTDHTHLGQLLTYAAGFDANVIVWIAQEFRDEHREALDLLNHRTDEGTEFFGVEVELWKIGDSLPAVNFNLVATPNEWRNQAITNARAAGNVSEKNRRYREFFQKLVDILRVDHQFTNAKKGNANSWHSFAAGITGLSYQANFVTGPKARVELYINSDRELNKEIFVRLEETEGSDR